MRLIESNNHDPYFNLAAEEYLLKNDSDDVFMIWISEPSVIVGKHQNTLAEINYRFAMDRKIKIARRLSGGGTVFHDYGNVNFTWIMNGEPGRLVDFRKFVNPIINILDDFSISAEYGGRNDILLNGKKISGNAEHVFKNRTLHHGTLLFSSDLDQMGQILKINPHVYRDKAVKSVRSKTTNISQYIGKNIKINDFTDHIVDKIREKYQITGTKGFNSKEHSHIQSLVNNKYSLWDWIYGYSPSYSINKNIRLDAYNFLFQANVKSGKFVTFNLQNKHITPEDQMRFENIFDGALHQEKDLTIKMEKTNFSRIFPDIDIKDFVRELF